MFLHLLKNILYFPLLGLKGIQHYWQYFRIFSWGLKHMFFLGVEPQPPSKPPIRGGAGGFGVGGFGVGLRGFGVGGFEVCVGGFEGGLGGFGVGGGLGFWGV